jgi:hypothetical protein
MKAKEMAAKFQANPIPETAAELLHACIMESKALVDQRKVKTDAGLLAVFRELDDKWKAFARLCPEVNPGGFKLALHRVIPVSKELWP